MRPAGPSSYLRSAAHSYREPPISALSAARSSPLARLVFAVSAVAIAGCGHDPATRFAPAPVERATTVIVRDALAAPVANATVFAVRLDEIETLVAGATDAAGAAHFTLAEGRWAVSTRVARGAGLAQVAGSTGRVPGAVPGVADTVLFRLVLATESVAMGHSTLAGRTDHSGTIVSAVELPALASTDATGAWTLASLPPGVWTGIATHFGFRTAVFDLVVPAPNDTVTVAASVLQPGGSPTTPR